MYHEQRSRLTPSNILIGMSLAITALGVTSAEAGDGIVVESTELYNPCGIGPNLPATGPEIDGFVNGMTPVSGIGWSVLANWKNNDAWDRDLYDSDKLSGADDNVLFDQPGAAISFYAGHGTCDDVPNGGTTIRNCTTSSQCTGPGFGQTGPGVCTRGPNRATGTCLYRTARQAILCSTNDGFGHFVNYSNGNVAFGESSVSGAWRGAGTNGGVNFAALDISCGIRPGLEVQGMVNAFGGIHNIATIMPTTWDSDTADSPDRGPQFAARWRANPNSSIAGSWTSMLNSVTGGGSCNGTSSGNHGIFGCGANWVASVAESQTWAQFLNGTESWVQARDDANDTFGAVFMAWIFTCNYDCNANPITN